MKIFKKIRQAIWFGNRGLYHFEEYMCRDVGGDLESKMRKVFRDHEVKGL